MQNPYLPTNSPVDQPPSRPAPRTGSFFTLLWFVAGATLATQIGLYIDWGIELTFKDGPSVVHLFSLTFNAVMGFIVLALSALWRLPRRWLFGKHPKTRLGCFSGGVTFSAVLHGSFALLQRLGVNDWGRKQEATQLLIYVVLLVISLVAAVETESRSVAAESIRHRSTIGIKPNERRQDCVCSDH